MILFGLKMICVIFRFLLSILSENVRKKRVNSSAKMSSFVKLAQFTGLADIFVKPVVFL